MSLPSLFPSPPRKSFSSHAIRFERISPINFISQFMQRPRHGSVYKWKRGRWTREEYGSTWLFRARSDRSSPHFPTNSAPATKGKGKRRGGSLEVAAERILRDVLISYLLENRFLSRHGSFLDLAALSWRAMIGEEGKEV